MGARKLLLTIAVVGVAVAMAAPSQAARFGAYFFGEVMFADEGGPDPDDPTTNLPNQFGLSEGDTISGFATYDTDLLAAGFLGFTDGGDVLSFISVGQGSGFAFELTVGTQTFSASDDDSFADPFLPFPELYFIGESLAGFDFQGTNTNGFYFESFPSGVFLDDLFAYTGGVILQDFFGEDPDEYSDIDSNFGGGFVFPVGEGFVVPVDDNNNVIPEPGTMVLLGSGLLGLAGYGRKRRKG